MYRIHFLSDFWQRHSTLPATLRETLEMTTRNRTKQLSEAARGILDDLNTRLSWAINTWSRSTNTKRDREHPSWPQLSSPAALQLHVANSSSHGSKNNSSPNLRKTAETTHLYDTPKHWSGCIGTQAMHNPSTLPLASQTPWWMQDKDQYALCQPCEQGQLENAARVIRSNRVTRQHQENAAKSEKWWTG